MSNDTEMLLLLASCQLMQVIHTVIKR